MSSDHNHDPMRPFNPGPTGRSYDNQIETLADLKRFEASQPDWQIRQNREAAAKARAAAEAARNPGPTGRNANDDTHGTKFWTDSQGVQHAGPLHPNGSYARGGVHDALQGQQGGFTSIRDRSGSMQSVAQMTEDSIVGIAGVGEMTLRSALAAGYVQASGSNGNSGAPAAPLSPQYAPQDDPQDAVEPEVHPDLVHEDLKSDAAEEVVAEFADRATQETQTAVIDEMATAGELTEQTAGRVAAEMGLMPEEAEAKMASTRAAFEDQAREAVRDVVGDLVDVDDIFAYYGQKYPEKAQAIVTRHMKSRQTGGYREMATEILETLPDVVGVENLLQYDFSGEGIKLTYEKIGGKDTVVVTTKAGNQMSWSSAVKHGFLKVPGRK